MIHGHRQGLDQAHVHLLHHRVGQLLDLRVNRVLLSAHRHTHHHVPDLGLTHGQESISAANIGRDRTVAVTIPDHDHTVTDVGIQDHDRAVMTADANTTAMMGDALVAEVARPIHRVVDTLGTERTPSKVAASASLD